MVIGEIFPHSSKKHWYNLTAIGYLTRWDEVIPLKKVKNQEVIFFIN